MLETVRKKRLGAFADRRRARLGARFLRCIEDVETLDLAASALLEGADEPTGLTRLALAGIGDGVALDFAQAAGAGRVSGGWWVVGCRPTRRGGRTDHLSQAVRVRGRLR